MMAFGPESDPHWHPFSNSVLAYTTPQTCSSAHDVHLEFGIPLGRQFPSPVAAARGRLCRQMRTLVPCYAFKPMDAQKQILYYVHVSEVLADNRCERCQPVMERDAGRMSTTSTSIAPVARSAVPY